MGALVAAMEPTWCNQSEARTNASIPALIVSGRLGQAWITAIRSASTAVPFWAGRSARSQTAPLSAPPCGIIAEFPEELAGGSNPVPATQERPTSNGRWPFSFLSVIAAAYSPAF
jgi:hypothetical protein